MVNHKVEAQAIKNAIHEAQSILLVAHKRPDGDTVGSVCAWLNFLTPKNKQVEAFCADPVPDYLKHLPGSHIISQDPLLFGKAFDLIIVNDSGALDYAGIDHLIAARDNSATTLINVDHHRTNPHYGDINLVIADASATTEVITRLFLHWDEELAKPIAESLLNGLISDTDKLTNPATSYHALTAVAKLVGAGADLHASIQRNLYHKSIPDLKLWGRIMSRLTYNPSYASVASYVTHQDIAELGAEPESVNGVSNYLSLIPEADIMLFLYEHSDGNIKGSLRTRNNTIDVGALALVLGGGGHQKAAGFTISGTLRKEGTNWTIV